MRPNFDSIPQGTRPFHSLPRILLAIAAAAGLGGPLCAAPEHGVYELPASRVTKWDPGVPGGIPAYTEISATIEASAHGNGSADARAAIQGALDAAGGAARDGTGRVVALSAGTFSISRELYVQSRVVLRGAGPDSTRLVAIGNNHPLVVIGPSLLPRPGDSNANAPSHPTVSSEGNAIYITFFRNHSTGIRRNTPRFLSDTQSRRIAAAMKGHYWYNFVGNVLGYAGMQPTPPEGWVYEGSPPWPDTPVTVWRIGYWNQDPSIQDPMVGQTIIRDGNYDFVTSSVHWHQTPGFTGALPDSLYLSAKPAFFRNNPWPWVDPLGPTKTFTLPAKARYDAGKPNG